MPVVVSLNFLAGMFWSGVEVTYLNLLLGFSPERNRAMFMAGFTLFTALIGGALAFVAGGLFLDLTRPLVARLDWRILGAGVTNYQLLFVLSSILRGTALLLFLPPLREERSSSPRQMVRQMLRRGRRSAPPA